MPHLADLVHHVIQIWSAAVIKQGGDAQSKQVLSTQTGEEVILEDAEPADMRSYSNWTLSGQEHALAGRTWDHHT